MGKKKSFFGKEVEEVVPVRGGCASHSRKGGESLRIFFAAKDTEAEVRKGDEGVSPSREKEMGSLLKLKAVDFCMERGREEEHSQEGLQERV
jgi:hypothetical protein